MLISLIKANRNIIADSLEKIEIADDDNII